MQTHGRPCIDILYFDGCPNHPPAVEMAHQVVRRLGVEAVIREVAVCDAEEAARLRFLGSPTVHVDGEDVEPAARSRTDFSFSCRLYGTSGRTLRELLELALRDAARRIAS